MKTIIDAKPGSKMSRFMQSLAARYVPTNGTITSCELKEKALKGMGKKVLPYAAAVTWIFVALMCGYQYIVNNLLGARYTVIAAVVIAVSLFRFRNTNIVKKAQAAIHQAFLPSISIGKIRVPWAVIGLLFLAVLISGLYILEVQGAKTVKTTLEGPGILAIIILGFVTTVTITYMFLKVAKSIYHATFGKEEIVYVNFQGEKVPVIYPKYMAWAIKHFLCTVYDLRS